MGCNNTKLSRNGVRHRNRMNNKVGLRLRKDSPDKIPFLQSKHFGEVNSMSGANMGNYGHLEESMNNEGMEFVGSLDAYSQNMPVINDASNHHRKNINTKRPFDEQRVENVETFDINPPNTKILVYSNDTKDINTPNRGDRALVNHDELHDISITDSDYAFADVVFTATPVDQLQRTDPFGYIHQQTVARQHDEKTV